MSRTLCDYTAVDALDQIVSNKLESAWPELSKVMSPAGVDTYVNSIVSLTKLGKGTAPALAFAEHMPALVKECGEGILDDTMHAAMQLASMVSGDVIALLFTSLPGAARCLGDANLVRAYLQFVHQFSSTSARALRPMLTHMDELLTKLTLSGLKRWAKFGTEAYRRDFNNLTAYFALETEDARAVLQNERRGVLLVGVQRKLNFYLRALWGSDFFLFPTGSDTLDQRPYIEDHRLHLPDALDDQTAVSALEIYRGTATHMAAHLCYAKACLPVDQLSPAQRYFIGLIEDARVEYCAIAQFPGLKNLWWNLLCSTNASQSEHPTLPWIVECAKLLLETTYRSADPELNLLAAEFHDQIANQSESTHISWRIGLALFDLFATRKAMPSLRILESLSFTYRDDNRHLWVEQATDWHTSNNRNGNNYESARLRQVHRDVGIMEMINEVDCELAGSDAQEVWTCTTELYPYEDNLGNTESYNQRWGKERPLEPFHYPEWDYQIQWHRPAWTTVYEQKLPTDSPDVIARILQHHKPVVQRIRYIIDLLAPAGVQRIRNLVDGDEIDLNAAIDAMIAMRSGDQPSQRITLRNVIKSRDLAVIVLMDLSESTNDSVMGSDKSVLDLTREAATLVSTAIEGVGDNFALHGFASDGRHDVHYYRFKDFNQTFDYEAQARLAGMQGGLSTRMGSAMRHAGYYLSKQTERRKLLLLVTDGEPADVDEPDPQYLRRDAKKAVEELHHHGVLTYCLTLDADADEYVKRIFGENHYTIVESVEKLPEKLPQLFASLTG